MLSVIITHHHTLHLLNNCLQSLQSALKNLEHEILVCDNHCSGRGCLASQWPKVIFFCFTQNLGYTALVNYGLRQARGNYFLILNADTVIPENSIILILDYLRRHPKIGLLGPKLVGIDRAWQPSCFREQTPWSILARRTYWGKTKRGKQTLRYFFYQDKDLSQIQPVAWLEGAALLISKKTLETVGLLDQRFFMYLSDADWARRCWQQGLEVVYFPKAEIVHCQQRDSNSGHGIFDIFCNRMTRVHLRDALRYFWKWRKIKLK